MGLQDETIDAGMALALLKERMLFVGPPARVTAPKRKLPKKKTRPPKRASIMARHSLNEFDDDEKDSGEDDEEEDNDAVDRASTVISVDLELLAYKSLHVTPEDKLFLKESQHKSGALLGWWKAKASTFPIMSRAVRSIFCIPASSSKSENNFSDAGNIKTKKRSCLKHATLDMLMFVRSK